MAFADVVLMVVALLSVRHYLKLYQKVPKVKCIRSIRKLMATTEKHTFAFKKAIF